MKKRHPIFFGLLILGNANVGIARAQPLDVPPLYPTPARSHAEMQRAEASARIMAFATETLRSQLPPKEFALWPLALRDALPYWLEYQPFENWSPELQQFALGKFQALADDTKVETFAPDAKNKAAVAAWLQEKKPLENAQLRFYLNVRLGLRVRDQKNNRMLDTSRFVPLSISDKGWEAFEIVKFGRLVNSLSPQQKAELFANNMLLPFAQLSVAQRQILDELFDAKKPKLGEMSLDQFPNREITIDFQFYALSQRLTAGKFTTAEKESFEVPIARPFDNFADECR